MGENSKIEWTHHTFNPWRGCVKVSPGCDHCYAERQSKRNPGVLGVWGADGVRVPAADSYWAQPVSWDRKAAAARERRRVFCASLADVCEILPQTNPSYMVPVEARRRLVDLIERTPHLDWLLLTKRPENIGPNAAVGGCFFEWDWRGRWPQNVWLGVSVENQAAADKRIPLLLRVPAAVRFLSIEPLLGLVDLEDTPGWLMPISRTTSRINWVIVGGESGPAARPIHPDWARSIRDQCQAAGVPFFFKQWGSWFPSRCVLDSARVRLEPAQPVTNLHRLQMWDGTAFAPPPAGALLPDVYRSGAVLTVPMDKHAAGRELDGRTWDEFPEVR